MHSSLDFPTTAESAATPSVIAQNLREFAETYGQKINETPTTPDQATVDLRLDLISEEMQELTDAVAAKDFVEVADALADIVYIAFGTALAYGFSLDAVLAEVHRSNMSKLDANGKPIYRADGKVLKGAGYFPPNIPKVLGLAGNGAVETLNSTP